MERVLELNIQKKRASKTQIWPFWYLLLSLVKYLVMKVIDKVNFRYFVTINVNWEKIISSHQFSKEYYVIKYAKTYFAFFISGAKNSTQRNVATCGLRPHGGIRASVVYSQDIFTRYSQRWYFLKNKLVQVVNILFYTAIAFLYFSIEEKKKNKNGEMISKTLGYLFSRPCKERFIFSVDSNEQVSKFGHESTKSNMLASEPRVRKRDCDFPQGDRCLHHHAGGPQNPAMVAAWLWSCDDLSSV